MPLVLPGVQKCAPFEVGILHSWTGGLVDHQGLTVGPRCAGGHKKEYAGWYFPTGRGGGVWEIPSPCSC